MTGQRHIGIIILVSPVPLPQHTALCSTPLRKAGNMKNLVNAAHTPRPGSAPGSGKKRRSTEPLKLLKFAAKYWPLVLLGPLFMVLEVSVDLFQPRMMEVIVDR